MKTFQLRGKLVKSPKAPRRPQTAKSTYSRPKSVKVSQQKDLLNIIGPMKLIPKEVCRDEVPVAPARTPDYYFRVGCEKRSQGDFQGAVQQYQKCFGIIPYHLPSRINIGVCFMKLGRNGDAIKNFTLALKHHADNPLILFNRALAHLTTADFTSALADINLAVDKQPWSEEFYKVRGMIYYKLGQPNKAMDSLNKSQKAPTKFVAYQHSSPKINANAKIKTQERPASSTPLLKKRAYKLSALEQEDPLERITGHVFKIKDKFDQTKSFDKGYNITPKKQDKFMKRLKSARPRIGLKPQRSFITGIREDTDNSPNTLKSSEKPRSRTPFLMPPEISEKIRRKTVAQAIMMENPTEFDNDELHMEKLDEHAADHIALRKTDDTPEIIERDLRRINNTLTADRKKIHATPEFNFENEVSDLNLELPRLSKYSLELIRQQYILHPDNRDYEKLVSITSNLKFFAKFAIDVRKTLFRIAQFETIPSGTTIFKQGDTGDMMYVILYGAIGVIKNSAEFGPNELPVNSLTDGDQFGELAIISSHTVSQTVGRSATCTTKETTHLLKISKYEYHEILIKYIQFDIDWKIRFFQELDVFQSMQAHDLIPLVSNLDAMTFTLGEKIVRKGEYPPGLCIVKSGQALVQIKLKAQRGRKNSTFASARIRGTPLRTFKNKTFKDSNVGSPKANVSRASSWFPQDQADENQISEIHVHKTLSYGDMFGGRVLLYGEVQPSYEKEAVNMIAQTGMYKTVPSKFDVICHSHEVVVYIITKWHINFLSSHVAEQILRNIRRMDDIDCPSKADVPALQNKYRNWEKQKSNMIESFRRKKFVEKVNGGFPNKILCRS